MMRIYRAAAAFVGLLTRAAVTAHAAQAAFFIFLSFFPFAILLLMILQHWPVLNERLLALTLDFFPAQISQLLADLFADLHKTSSSVTLISVTAAVAVWSAGKGVIAVIRGLNAVFGAQETRNVFLLRLRVLGYTLLILVLVVVTLGIIVLGGAVTDWLSLWLGLPAPTFWGRTVTLLILMTALMLLFTAMYVYLPAKKQKFSQMWLGALVAAVGWEVFSLVFSVYVERFSNLSVTYGSLTSVVVLMLWLYACMYILFLGAAVNCEPKEA